MILKILTSASHMLLDIELYKKKLWHSGEKDTGKGATVSEKYLNIQSSQKTSFYNTTYDVKKQVWMQNVKYF